MGDVRNISKSRFCSGLQCLRRLWWEIHDPDAPELAPGAALQAVFDRGHRVGELARERFPGGTLVDLEPWRVREKVEATEAALRDGARVIFEASFAAGGVFAAIDVLERLRDGSWALVEVKSTLDAKPQFVPDVAVQLHAARAAGLSVRRVELMHLNRACVYPHLEDLFVRDDLTADAEALQPGIPSQVAVMRAALEGSLPEVAPGPHCRDPYDCPFFDRCNPPLPDDDVGHLYNAREAAVTAWRAAGIRRLADLPGDALSAPQRRQVRAAREGSLVVDPGLGDALGAIALPVAFLDFETVNPAVPVWGGCHPYEAVPVQVSCHVLFPGGAVEHRAHLASGPGDPRPGIAQAVVRACDAARTVVAYSAGFEARCLDQLADAVPALAAPLRSIRARLVDLLPIVRDHVYHPGFGGGFGLKAVLPALVPGAGYGDLEVADGGTASALLEALLLAPDRLAGADPDRIRAQLLAYCGRDTEALVKLHERLQTLASGER